MISFQNLFQTVINIPPSRGNGQRPILCLTNMVSVLSVSFATEVGPMFKRSFNRIM